MSEHTELDKVEGEARRILEKAFWPFPDRVGKPLCPNSKCGTMSCAEMGGKFSGRGRYRCRKCNRRFTVSVKTPLNHTHIPMATWIHGLSIFANDRKCSARGLQRQLDLGSWRTAKSMIKRMKKLFLNDKLKCAPWDLYHMELVDLKGAIKNLCHCGCGESTKGGRYRPGHDAKHKSALKAASRSGDQKARDLLQDLGW